MKKIIYILILLAFTLLPLTAKENTIKAAGDLTWFTSYSAALEDAKTKDNVVIVNFTGSDWCKWCKKIVEDVFSTDQFHKWQKNNATLLFLDFPQKKYLTEDQINHNQMLAELYGVQGFPTILILSKEGRLIGKSGYADSADKWIKSVDTSVAMFKAIVEKL